MIRLDDWLLRQADAFVLFMWNRAAVPRITWMRVTWIITTVAAICAAVTRKSGADIMDWVAAVALLLGLTMEELREAVLPKPMLNAQRLMVRAWPPVRLVRWFVWLTSLPSIVGGFALHTPTAAFAAISSMAIIPGFWLMHSLTPEQPPKRREERRASLILARARL